MDAEALLEVQPAGREASGAVQPGVGLQGVEGQRQQHEGAARGGDAVGSEVDLLTTSNETFCLPQTLEYQNETRET